MSDEGEFWRDVTAARQEKRASNRESSADMLKQNGIKFRSNNGGAHLIVEGPTCFIDFWPGTGRWSVRAGNQKGFGVRNLIALFKEQP